MDVASVIVAMATLLTAVGGVIVGLHQLQKVHVLVNSRLTEALDKISRLESRLQHLTGEQPTGEPPRRGQP